MNIKKQVIIRKSLMKRFKNCVVVVQLNKSRLWHPLLGKTAVHSREKQMENMRKLYDKKTLKTAQEEKGKRAENKTERTFLPLGLHSFTDLVLHRLSYHQRKKERRRITTVLLHP